jgi:hypothetical protein
MDEANPASDRYFDLSLRLLTIFVLVALFCCVAFLAFRLLEPRFKKPSQTFELHETQAPPPAATTITASPPADEVLMDPHKTFRCVEQGKVTFSDRTCDSGSVQILPSPSQPTTGAR